MNATGNTIISRLAVLLIILFFVGLIIFKGKMNSFLSQTIITQNDPVSVAAVSAHIDSVWNYSKSSDTFEVTFLEFGSKGCSACRRMESVLDEFLQKYPERVNVVFINVLLPENQSLMKFYGVTAIPTQILLNRDGREFFRHSGYISFRDLSGKFNN